MNIIENQIIETWLIHNRVILYTIQNISGEAFKATLSKRGGREIARQFAHLHMVRVTRLEAFSKKIKTVLKKYEKDESPSKSDLLQSFEQTGKVLESYIRFCLENEGVVSNFKRGVIPMIGYYISHESHHRGNILLTMKQCGFKLPDALKWGIWEWNKI